MSTPHGLRQLLVPDFLWPFVEQLVVYSGHVLVRLPDELLDDPNDAPCYVIHPKA